MNNTPDAIASKYFASGFNGFSMHTVNGRLRSWYFRDSFVGSIFVPPGPPRVKMRREGPDVIVSWKRTAWPYVLQAAAEPMPQGNWQDIAPPYSVAGRDYEVRITNVAAFAKTFFRLRL